MNPVARQSWADRLDLCAIESMPMWPVKDYQKRDMDNRLIRWQMDMHMQQSGCAKQQKLLQALRRTMHVSVQEIQVQDGSHDGDIKRYV